MTLSRRSLPFLILALLLVCAQAIAQPAQNRRIRGTIEGLDGNVLMVKARDGSSVKINLADNWAVTAYTKAQISRHQGRHVRRRRRFAAAGRQPEGGFDQHLSRKCARTG